MNYIVRREDSALWRENDDGSILILSEDTGRAFILSETYSDLWSILKTPISVSQLLKKVHNKDKYLFLEQIEKMIKSQVLNATVEHTTCIDDESSSTCVSTESNCQIDESPVLLLDTECEFTEIYFGACDCQGHPNWAGFIRWLACEYGDENRTQSVVI